SDLRRRRQRALFNFLLLIATGLATLSAAEVALTIAGLDREQRIQTAHPPITMKYESTSNTSMTSAPTVSACGPPRSARTNPAGCFGSAWPATRSSRAWG